MTTTDPMGRASWCRACGKYHWYGACSSGLAVASAYLNAAAKEATR